MSLEIAKQKALSALGQKFYVTKKGIKQGFELFGLKYTYEVEANEKEIIINGKKEPRTDKKTSISQNVRDSADEKTSFGNNGKRSSKSSN